MVLLESKELSLGFEAKDFNLKDISEKFYKLSDFTDKLGLLIFFTCNHCPYAQTAWPQIIDLYKKNQDWINFVAINPNDDIEYPEDSFDLMKELKKELNFDFPYLRDDTQEVAKAYQAQCTPDIYLFKIEENSPKLFYHGRINDNWQNPDLVEEKNLEQAIDKLLKNETPPEKQMPSIGCSIKWKENI